MAAGFLSPSALSCPVLYRQHRDRVFALILLEVTPFQEGVNPASLASATLSNPELGTAHGVCQGPGGQNQARDPTEGVKPQEAWVAGSPSPGGPSVCHSAPAGASPTFPPGGRHRPCFPGTPRCWQMRQQRTRLIRASSHNRNDLRPLLRV